MDRDIRMLSKGHPKLKLNAASMILVSPMAPEAITSRTRSH